MLYLLVLLFFLLFVFIVVFVMWIKKEKTNNVENKGGSSSGDLMNRKYSDNEIVSMFYEFYFQEITYKRSIENVAKKTNIPKLKIIEVIDKKGSFDSEPDNRFNFSMDNYNYHKEELVIKCNYLDAALELNSQKKEEVLDVFKSLYELLKKDIVCNELKVNYGEEEAFVVHLAFDAKKLRSYVDYCVKNYSDESDLYSSMYGLIDLYESSEKFKDTSKEEHVMENEEFTLYEDVDNYYELISKLVFLVAAASGHLDEEYEDYLCEIPGLGMFLIEHEEDVKKKDKSVFGLVKHQPMFNYLIDNMNDVGADYRESGVHQKEFIIELLPSVNDYVANIIIWSVVRAAAFEDHFHQGSKDIIRYVCEGLGYSLEDHIDWVRSNMMQVHFGDDLDIDTLSVYSGDEEDLLLGEDDYSLDDQESIDQLISDLPAPIQALTKQDISAFKAIIEYGGDINARFDFMGMENQTALMLASANYDLPLVTYMIEKGADINCKADNGYTALTCAVMSDDIEKVKYLLNSGSEIDPVNNREHPYSPIAMSAVRGTHDIFELLLKHKANINWINSDGNSILKIACASDNIESSNLIVKKLITLGADVNSYDDFGFSPAHNAIDKGNTKLLELLINSGVSPSQKIKSPSEDAGKSLLMKACLLNNIDMVDYLLTVMIEDLEDNSKLDFIESPENPTNDFKNHFSVTLLHALLNGDEPSNVVSALCAAGFKADFMACTLSVFFPENVSKSIINSRKDSFICELSEENIQATFFSLICNLLDNYGPGFHQEDDFLVNIKKIFHTYSIPQLIDFD